MFKSIKIHIYLLNLWHSKLKKNPAYIGIITVVVYTHNKQYPVFTTHHSAKEKTLIDR